MNKTSACFQVLTTTAPIQHYNLCKTYLNLKNNTIHALLTKRVRSRWLDIGQVIFFAFLYYLYLNYRTRNYWKHLMTGSKYIGYGEYTYVTCYVCLLLPGTKYKTRKFKLLRLFENIPHMTTFSFFLFKAISAHFFGFSFQITLCQVITDLNCFDLLACISFLALYHY